MKRLRIIKGLLLGTLAVGTTGAIAAGAAPASTPASTARGFSWPADAGVPAARGGSSAGAPVTLDRDPSPAWQALQAPGLGAQERDRRAILAMAGAYRITFDFQEIVNWTPLGKPAAPYQTWGTEKVYVDVDTPGFVSLLHVLEMRTVDEEGTIADPVIVKHWRQEWTYQPTLIVEYVGADRWQRRAVPEVERLGTWSQTVTQVDESPRYAGLGQWQHTPSFSTWISNETWRPLPRREWTVRKDYQVLLGTNRHTIGPTGWIQEENNLKTVITGPGRIDPALPYLAREYGVARYERLHGADFAQADDYHLRTRVFWGQVRQRWASAFANHDTIQLRGQPDQKGYYKPLFERADEIAEKPATADALADAKLITAALDETGLPSQ